MKEETAVFTLDLTVNLSQKFISNMLLCTTHFIKLLHVVFLIITGHPTLRGQAGSFRNPWQNDGGTKL